MGRTKEFDRSEVLAKTVQVLWKYGFAGTSLKDLEKATGVNKSGLYSEFKDKDDLFYESLKFYVEHSGAYASLLVEPLGWQNIENYFGPCSGSKNSGCFLVNTIRELPLLKPQIRSLIVAHFDKLRLLIVKNLEADAYGGDTKLCAELIVTFIIGSAVEHSISDSASTAKRMGAFVSSLRDTPTPRRSKKLS